MGKTKEVDQPQLIDVDAENMPDIKRKARAVLRARSERTEVAAEAKRKVDNAIERLRDAVHAAKLGKVDGVYRVSVDSLVITLTPQPEKVSVKEVDDEDDDEDEDDE